MFFYDDLNKFLDKIETLDLPLIISKGVNYYNVPMAFDIEVSSINTDEKFATMYVWQFAINDDVVIGRDWNSFKKLMCGLKRILNLNSNRFIVVYVHNLAYEFQFIMNRFKWLEVFATDIRKPLYAKANGVIFKCSYRLSGYSLETVAKNLHNSDLKKLKGDLDYSLVRHSETPLTFEEINYCVNDVLIVTHYINEQINEFGDISKIPNTQTGKVRRLVRNNCMKSNGFKYKIRELTLDNMEYVQLRKAFQGGFTHSNFIYTNEVISDVCSLDFTSSYPFVMLSEQYPMSKGKYIEKIDIDFFEVLNKDFLMVFDLRLTNVNSVAYEQPISKSKCIKIKNAIENNGRVFSCDELITTITNVDFDIIKKTYNFDDCEFRNIYVYKKDYLPVEFINTIIRLYKDKTELKGVKGKENEYLHSKELLNSCYGMTVTDLVNDKISFNNGMWETLESDLSESVSKYNNDRNRFLFYPWGVFVTAYARRNLFSGILEFKDDYIYSDTDSVKVRNIEKHRDYINLYNNTANSKLMKMCEHKNIPCINAVTIDGIEKPLGVWDFDGHYKRFKTLGAKRYLVEYDNDEVMITVAGLNKKSTVKYLKDKYKNNDLIFKMFEDNLTIDRNHSGKKTLNYVDTPLEKTITDYKGKIHCCNELSFVYMENSEYNLSMGMQYIDFLMEFGNYGKK